LDPIENREDERCRNTHGCDSESDSEEYACFMRIICGTLSSRGSDPIQYAGGNDIHSFGSIYDLPKYLMNGFFANFIIHSFGRN